MSPALVEHRQHTRRIKFFKYFTNPWSPLCTSTDNNFADWRTSVSFYNLSLKKIPLSVEYRNSNLTNQSWKRHLPIEQKGFHCILKLSVNRYITTSLWLVLITIKFLECRSNDIGILSYSSWIVWFRAIWFKLFAAVIITARILTDEERVKRWRKALSWMVAGSYRVIFHINFLYFCDLPFTGNASHNDRQPFLAAVSFLYLYSFIQLFIYFEGD